MDLKLDIDHQFLKPFIALGAKRSNEHLMGTACSRQSNRLWRLDSVNVNHGLRNSYVQRNPPRTCCVCIKFKTSEESIPRLQYFSDKSSFCSYSNYADRLDACIRSRSLSEGKKIHQEMVGNNTHIKDFMVLEKLAHMYLSCNEMELARLVFDEIPNPRVILWNLMIRGYAWNGPYEKGVELYYQMLQKGTGPTKFTFPIVLKACSPIEAMEVGREVHDHVKKLGLESDVYICTALIDFYAKCGDLNEAERLFRGMPCKDVVTWNAMIRGFSLWGHYSETMRLVIQMHTAEISPNSSTVVAILPIVGQVVALREGMALHGYSVRRLLSDDVVVGTGLLDMYAKCQNIYRARRIFDMMEHKNEICWGAMIGGYVLCEYMREALRLYDEMVLKCLMTPTPIILGSVLRACAKLIDLSRGRQLHVYAIKSGLESNPWVGNSLLSMYAKCGTLDDALRFFHNLELKDQISYSAMISGCVQNGYTEHAILIFRQMQLSGVEPDAATILSLLPGCSHLAALRHGRCCHAYSTVRGFAKQASIGNALIDMYSKCGQINIAREVFDRMHNLDIISWNTIIIGYGIHGLGQEALSLFHKFLAFGLDPDDVSFIAVLSTCSHSGLVAEGKHWFRAMTQEFNIIPRMAHYICVVDLLGRAGHLEEACKFIQDMPFQPDIQVWAAVLSACRIHKNIELGKEVSKKIDELGPEGTGNFVLMSNIYSAGGRWDDAALVRITQKYQGFKKTPGCSWVEISGVLHGFIGGDQSHPQSTLIYNKLEELLADMKKLGYRGDGSFVLQDVEEEEKERILLYHSEKIAIAFGILNTSPNKPILVTKNLRVCVDCHNAIKFMTLITKRDITVRDACRFHHFRKGKCNCGDFW